MGEEKTNGGRAGSSREVTEGLLIDSALDLLRERGILVGMNLSEIADRAEVTRGLAYHYFGSRRELLRSAAKRQISQPREPTPSIDELTFADWFTATLQRSLRFDEAVWLIALLVLDHDDSVRTLTRRGPFFEELDELRAQGRLAIDDYRTVYALFASIIYGFSLFGERFADELDVDVGDLRDRMITVIHEMLTAVQTERADGADRSETA